VRNGQRVVLVLTAGNFLPIHIHLKIKLLWEGSDVRWKIFHRKFSRTEKSQKIFRFLKSSLNISFFNLFLVALGLTQHTATVR
jgi:hypothetical protein